MFTFALFVEPEVDMLHCNIQFQYTLAFVQEREFPHGCMQLVFLSRVFRVWLEILGAIAAPLWLDLCPFRAMILC